MKQFLSLILAAAVTVLVVGCGKPAPIESVESLVADAERLKELRAQCKADHDKVGDAQCNAVAEATRQRFLGNGGPKYTPPASPPAAFIPPSSPASSPEPAASVPAPKD